LAKLLACIVVSTSRTPHKKMVMISFAVDEKLKYVCYFREQQTICSQKKDNERSTIFWHHFPKSLRNLQKESVNDNKMSKKTLVSFEG
jgi:hypothetical protein